MERFARELGTIAEMALGASSLEGFEAEWLRLLQPRIGFDTACSVWSGSDGAVLQVTSLGYAGALLRARFPAYMGELSASEVARFSAPEPVVDLDVLSPRRRQQLTVYQELLAPARVSSFVTNVWQSRWGVFGYHLGRTCSARPFSEREARALGRVAPCIKLGQALLAREAQSPPARADAEWWAQAWSLSGREVETLRLLARGFSNPEIATLLRISRHTVRNHLARVFAKADVSSRTELVFSMTSTPEQSLSVRSRRHARRDAWQEFLATDGTQ